MKVYYDVYESVDQHVLVSCLTDGVPHRLPSNWCLVGGYTYSEHKDGGYESRRPVHHIDVYHRWINWADHLWYSLDPDNDALYDKYIRGSEYHTKPADFDDIWWN